MLLICTLSLPPFHYPYLHINTPTTTTITSISMHIPLSCSTNLLYHHCDIFL